MEISYKALAVFNSSHQETYEAPRQGVLSKDATGWFELGSDFISDSIEDLKGFERIWLIYDFHKNKTWKPKVRPPRFSDKKRSVFSTRSPYRPNSIGMSCVKLEKIEGKKVFVSEHDLLDGSLILDIKPYLPYADSFPDAQTGWIKMGQSFEVRFSDEALKKIIWLEKRSRLSFKQIVFNQLSFEPQSSKAKRVKKVEGGLFVFSVRTWRFRFRVHGNEVLVQNVYSGYSPDEMSANIDTYADKKLHLDFNSKFIEL